MDINNPIHVNTFEGLCNYLHTATLCSTDLEATKKFYVRAMGMTIEGPFELSVDEMSGQRNVWNIPDHIDYDYYLIHRPSVPSLVNIRFLHLKQETPHIHQSYSCRELGSFSLGFPNGDVHATDQRVEDQGFGRMAPLQEGEVTRDGKTFPYYETIHQGPDFVHCVSLGRGGGMPQVSPIDEETKLGGPGYSAFVTDNSDEELAFYLDVMDMKFGFDWVWEASPGSALGIPEGVPFRFAAIYAKGASQNHLLFLDYKDGIFEKSAAPSRVPNQGIGMWSFETKNIDMVLANAKQHNAKVITSPTKIVDPILGSTKTMTMETPGGLLIEIFQIL